jgi:hypothetical protein
LGVVGNSQACGVFRAIDGVSHEKWDHESEYT